MVLLKNAGGLLPLDPTKSVAVIGPLAKNQHDMLGPWWGVGRDQDAVTVFDGIKAQDPQTTYAEGCAIRGKFCLGHIGAVSVEVEVVAGTDGGIHGGDGDAGVWSLGWGG